jgi:DNA-binding MarR family transcriptional regulator
MKHPGRSCSRAELLDALNVLLRKVNAQSVLISDTVAKIVGHHSTDLECLDLLHLAGPMTAGRLAAHTGLTTGAMTAAIDRLEQAGFVRRRRDPSDRRCVRVEALPRAMDRIQRLYEPLAARMAQLNRGYSEQELAVVVEYLSSALEACTDYIGWLQNRLPEPKRGAAPRRPRTPAASRARSGRVNSHPSSLVSSS